MWLVTNLRKGRLKNKINDCRETNNTILKFRLLVELLPMSFKLGIDVSVRPLEPLVSEFNNINKFIEGVRIARSAILSDENLDKLIVKDKAKYFIEDWFIDSKGHRLSTIESLGELIIALNKLAEAMDGLSGSYYEFYNQGLIPINKTIDSIVDAIAIYL